MIPFIPLHFCICEYTAHLEAKLLQRTAIVLGQVSQETDSNMGICLRKFPVGCFGNITEKMKEAGLSSGRS